MNIDIASLIAGIDFTNPTWDLFVILFFVIGAFLYGFSLGRDRIIVILVSIYMSLAVVNTIPLINGDASISVGDVFAFKLTSFFVVFLFLFFLFARSGLLRTIAVGDNSGRWYHVLIFSILHVGLIISIAMSFLPPEYLNNFAPQTQQIFISEIGRFVWIIAPIFFMAVTKRGGEEKKK
jgi:hypothetical protein